MGADGGIKITEISDIKNNWKSIRLNLIKGCEYYFSNSESYTEKYFFTLLEKTTDLPKNIDKLTELEILNLFKIYSNCDCPFLYKNAIITGEGNNINEEMNILSNSLNGISIETWT